MTKLAVVFILMISENICTDVFGQSVVNDNIETRIGLQLDSASLRSSTHNANVQWKCINKHLTNKCLIYHNDQWFTIVPKYAGTFYINISNQICRDMNGVQLLVIEGNPCETSSYRLKKCIDFTDQADFFIQLDSLIPDKEYLINVDGFLGDQCEFDISFNSYPAGLPIRVPSLSEVDIEASNESRLVTIRWTVTDSVLRDVRSFGVYRKKSGTRKSTRLESPMIYNAKGELIHDYFITDTVQEKGEYRYSIYRYTDQGVFLLGSRNIVVKDVMPAKPALSLIQDIEYFVADDGYVDIRILTQAGENLYSFSRRSDKGYNRFTLDFSSFVKSGYTELTMLIKNKLINERRKFSF